MKSYPIPQSVPEAQVASRKGPVITINCPLCGAPHEHIIRDPRPNQLAWRAAACNLYAHINRDDRNRGYVFIEKEGTN